MSVPPGNGRAAVKTHLDLCSGIGGFALAAQWAGYRTIGFCEIESFAQRVLRRHWPDVPIHDDIRTLTGDIVRGWLRRATNRVPDAAGEWQPGEPGRTDAGRSLVGTGVGAGGRTGRGEAASGVPVGGGADPAGTATSRLDLLTAGYPCQPFSVAGKRLGGADPRHLWPEVARLVAETRPARFLGENVTGHIKVGLDAVLSDLETLGYAARPVVIPACAVGALHRRERVWIVAHA